MKTRKKCIRTRLPVSVQIRNTRRARVSLTSGTISPAWPSALDVADEAVIYLDHAVDAGYDNAPFMRTDEALKSLRVTRASISS